mgnify:CR=1 FL=1
MIQLNALPGQVLDGKYRIDKLLGRGGMGAVYMAQHLGTRRTVALKVIVPQKASSTEYLERFKREAESAGMLRHPNVVDVTDFGATDVGGSSIAYLVMEYLDGCDLQVILAEEQRMPVAWSVDILNQACSAVGEAHKRGIIHRDLKPANIWLEPDRLGGYNVKVLDFGLAKTDGVTGATIAPSGAAGSVSAPSTGSQPSLHSVPSEPPAPPPAEASEAPTVVNPVKAAVEVETLALPADGVAGGRHEEPTIAVTEIQEVAPTADQSNSLTRVGSIMGSPGYMSPEQCRGEAVDWRSDIYSMGVIAYEMLTGAKPFAGGDLRAVIKQTVEDEPADMETFRPDLPDAVCSVVMKALAKNPDDRPQSASVFGSTLRASAMGLGALLKMALMKFGDNAPVFLRIFAIAYLPFFALRILVNHVALGMEGGHEIILFTILILVGIIGNFVATALSRGLSAVVYSLTLAMPTTTIRLRTLLSHVRTTAHDLIASSFAYFGMVTVPITLVGGAIVFAIFEAQRMSIESGAVSVEGGRIAAGIVVVVAALLLIRNLPKAALLPIVALVEGGRFRESMARSQMLGNLDRRMIIGLGFVEAFVWLVLQTIRFFALSLVIYTPVEKFGQALVSNVETVEIGAIILSMSIEIVIGPVIALVFAALYLKLRLSSGETMESIVSKQFVLPDTPHTGWQQRMQKRLSSQV